MKERLEKLAQAPDFALKDTAGNRVVLSEIYREQPVVLVITRGFM